MKKLHSFKLISSRWAATQTALTYGGLIGVHSEIVDFGSGRGLSVFATDGVAVTAIAGIVWLFRGLQKSENEALGQKMLFPDGH